MENQPMAEQLISYLSDIYNKSLPVYELMTSHDYQEELALVTINELFAVSQSALLYYRLSPILQTVEADAFFAAFEEFYSELKQIFLHEDDNTAVLYNKLTNMQELFEQLTTAYNAL